MLISIYSTSRQSGVPSTKSTTRRSVSTPTIGRTSGENPTFLIMTATSSARTGSQAHSSPSTTRDAPCKPLASTATAGKSKNTTPCTTRLCLARKKPQMVRASAREGSNVLTTTLRKTGDSLKMSNSNVTDLTSFTIKFSKCQ